MRRVSKKKGLSQIVSVVLIILIAVPAVFILWTTIFPMITDFLLDGKVVELTIISTEGYTVYDEANTMMSVHVERGNDEVDLEFISIAVSVEGTSTSYMVHSMVPGSNQVYYLGGVFGEPDKITVSAVKMDDGSIRTRECSSYDKIGIGKLLRDKILSANNCIYFSDGSMDTHSCQFTYGEKTIYAVEGSLCLESNGDNHLEGLCDNAGVCQFWECAVDLNCYGGNPCYNYSCDANHECEYTEKAECVLESGECGDEVINIGESCDGNYFSNNTCRNLVGDGYFGTLECVNDCGAIDIAGCELVIPDTCGDEILDDGEKCDGTQFRNSEGLTASSNACIDIDSLAFVGGGVDCNSDCTINFSDCVGGDDDTISYFTEGNGDADPFMIYNCYQLQNMTFSRSSNYKLARDINCSMTKDGSNGWWADGKGFLPVGCGDSNECGAQEGHKRNQFFTGSLDGDGYEISDLFIYRRSMGDVGLIGHLKGGMIENLGMIDSEITGRAYIGGIVGTISVGATVENCYNTGSLKASGLDGYKDVIGGIVGYSVSDTLTSEIEGCYNYGDVIGGNYVGGIIGRSSSTVEKSYNNGSVTGSGNHVGGIVGVSYSPVSSSYNLGFVNGGWNVGGIVGYSKSTIMNSYNEGTIGATQHIGGIAGSSESIIKNSYNVGIIYSGSNMGGIIGTRVGGQIVNSYYVVSSCIDVTCDDAGGTSLNSAAMRIGSNYIGWDFDSIWEIQEGANYPWLRWEIENTCGNGVVDHEPCDIVIERGVSTPMFRSPASSGVPTSSNSCIGWNSFLGYTAGIVTCTSECDIDFSDCDAYTCENNVCENWLGETPLNCPPDCGTPSVLGGGSGL